MPELPEVETVCRGLRYKIIGKKIIQYQQFREDLRWPIPKGVKEKIEGLVIKTINRRGKFIIVNLNMNYSVIIHLVIFSSDFPFLLSIYFLSR